jgi:uncharacterized membrane protein YccC
MVSHEVDHATQRQAVRRPRWFGAAVVVGVLAVIGLVWFMAVANVIVDAVIAVSAAIAWSVWLERHS